MADSQPSIFEQLNASVDPKLQEEKAKAAVNRERKQYEQAQARLAELIDANSTLPCTISSVRVLGAANTRPGFLKRVLDPLLSANHDRPYTLAEGLAEVTKAADKLNRFDIFHQPISLAVDRPSRTDPSSTPTDIDVYYSVSEKPRISLKTGTDVGNTEGSAFGSLLYRNLLGGAETLSLNAALGTRTRSSYQAAFETPLFANPDLRLEFGGVASSTQNPWSSHEEVLKSGWTKLRWWTKGNSKHELSYSGAWRQLTGLASNASPTVRADAGDSVKSSIAHSWTKDRRDSPQLPTRGLLLRTASELAGWGPLRGDVSFFKSELETQAAVPIPLPGMRNSGVSFTAGLRAGLLYPLSLRPSSAPTASRLNDRFQLGGPTSVRGFRIAGLGPRDGPDAVGGDVYAAGSANLLMPFPGVSPERPFRWQLFVTGGRLLALQGTGKEGGAMDSEAVRKGVYDTVAELGRGLPSTAAGVGLIYALPVARFELNFSLPLVLRKGEDARKGLQFGIGINFL